MSNYPISQTLLLLSTSNHGELLSPTLLSSQEEVDEIFGGRMSQAFSQAIPAKPPSIWGVRIPNISSNEDLYFALQDAYDLLLTFPADIIVPVDAFADLEINIKDNYNKNLSFVSQLGEFCKNSWSLGSYKIGLLGVSPNIDSEEDLIELNFKSDLEISNNNLQYSPFIGICAGSVIYKTNLDSYYDSPVISLAASIASQSEMRGLTNIKVSGSFVNPYMSDHIHRLMARNGIMSIQNNPRRGNVLYKAITCAEKNPYSNLTSMRILGNLLSIIKDKSDPFIGEFIGSEINGRTLRVLIDDILKSYEHIKSYDYDIHYKNNDCYLSLDLQLRGEITSITTITKLGSSR